MNELDWTEENGMKWTCGKYGERGTGDTHTHSLTHSHIQNKHVHDVYEYMMKMVLINPSYSSKIVFWFSNDKILINVVAFTRHFVWFDLCGEEFRRIERFKNKIQRTIWFFSHCLFGSPSLSSPFFSKYLNVSSNGTGKWQSKCLKTRYLVNI